MLQIWYVVWEIFTLKIICVKNFCGVKFSWFCSIHEIFLKVDDCNMNKRLENSWRLVYYQLSGEPGITGCSHRSDIYLGECGLACTSLFIDHCCFFFFSHVKFSRWISKFSRSTVDTSSTSQWALLSVVVQYVTFTSQSNSLKGFLSRQYSELCSWRSLYYIFLGILNLYESLAFVVSCICTTLFRLTTS